MRTKPLLDVVAEMARATGGAVTAAEVAERTGRDRANVSRELNKLAREGLLEKRPGRPVLFVPRTFAEISGGKNDAAPLRKLGSLKDPGDTNDSKDLQDIKSSENPASFENPTARERKTPSTASRSSFGRSKIRLPADFTGTALGELVAATGTLKEACERGVAAVLYPPSGLHTLIIGPTGSGKSTFARAMHSFAVESGAWPPNAPFVSLNCSEYSQNPNLLMSQLFGHVKGAFTGAYADKVGMVERASSGMLFLDEVHRLPPQGQEMLFQIIDRGTFRRLGETGNERRANLMLVAATTEEPSSYLLQTFLRRIPVVIPMPSLDEWKPSERYALIQKLLAEEADKLSRPVRLSAGALSYLMRASFPGNVGELKSRIQVACFRAFLSSAERGLEGELVVGLDALRDAGAGIRYSSERPVREMDSDISVAPGMRRPSGGSRRLTAVPVSIPAGDLRRTGISERAILDALEAEVRTYVDNLLFRSNESENAEGLSREEISGLCDPKVRSVLKEALPQIALRYGMTLSARALYALSVHITHRLRNRSSEASVIPSAVARSNPGAMMAMDVSGVDEKYIAASKDLADVLEKRLNVRPLPGEVGLIARIFQAEVAGGSGGGVTVLLALHGNGVARETASVVREILGQDIVTPVDLGLSWSLAEKARAIAAALEGKASSRGACVLTDMALPPFFASEIASKTGVDVKIVDGASLPLILDVVSRSLIPGISLAEIVGEVQSERPPGCVDLRPAGDSWFEDGKSVLVTAESRVSAERIRELLMTVFSEAIEEGLCVLTLCSPQDAVGAAGAGSGARFLAVAGITPTEPEGCQFISLQDMVSGEGLQALARVLERAGFGVPEVPGIRRRLLQKLSTDLLSEQLTFLKPERLAAPCLKILERIEDAMGVSYPTGACVRFMVHLACLVERLLLGQPVLEHPQATALFSTYSVLESVMSAVLKDIEQEFGCSIPLGEKAFLLEALTETGPVQ